MSCVVEKKCGEHLVENESNGLLCEAGSFEDFYRGRLCTFRKNPEHMAYCVTNYIFPISSYIYSYLYVYS